MSSLTLLEADRPRPAALFLMVHQAFRRDATRFARTLAAADPQSDRAERWAAHWQLYSGMLLSHHAQEDEGLFPDLLRVDASLENVIARLGREHAELDPLLEHIGVLLARRPLPRSEAAAAFGRLEFLLDAHLTREEQHLVPVMERTGLAPGGDQSANDTQTEQSAPWWESLAFPWAAEGIPEAVLDLVLPTPIKQRVAEASAAYHAHVDGLWLRPRL